VNWRFLALSPPGLLLATLSAAAQPEPECVQFGANRLTAGSSFTYSLPLGLEFRLASAGASWRIAIGPRDDPDADFLAPVSPPFRSSPHLVVGAAYGVPAHDSVRVTPRRLRFVSNRRAAQQARDIASAARVGDLQRLKDLDKLAVGRLTLQILDADADEEVVNWVAFAAEACLPAS
jgi:hypothetical protein